MTFQTGLSGLNAASKNLDIIGNNIANASTAGAKKSRTEFAEVIASTVGTGGGSGQGGIGVEISAVSQEFSQGNISVTGNELDLAINGDGFFPMIPKDSKDAANKASLYTRSGIFKLDKQGYIVNNNSEKLWGKNITVSGTTETLTEGPLKINTTASNPPKATSSIDTVFNLNAKETAWTSGSNVTTSPLTVTTFDTQGKTKDVNIYLRKVADNIWAFSPSKTGTDLATYSVSAANPPVVTLTAAAATGAEDFGLLRFDTSGQLVGSIAYTGTLGALTETTGTTLNIPAGVTSSASTIQFKGSTQYASNFSLYNLDQNGYAVGAFTGIKINEDGRITAQYDNGQTSPVCQLQLVSFSNNQGLQPVGGGNWIATTASGDPVPDTPGSGSRGLIRAGALEDSNVDLTGELVAMMTAQRAYQANVQTIKTQDQALSALTNLR